MLVLLPVADGVGICVPRRLCGLGVVCVVQVAESGRPVMECDSEHPDLRTTGSSGKTFLTLGEYSAILHLSELLKTGLLYAIVNWNFLSL